MALLQVAKLGDPILRQKAELVDLEFLNSQDNKMQALIDDMIETIQKHFSIQMIDFVLKNYRKKTFCVNRDRSTLPVKIFPDYLAGPGNQSS